MKRSSKNRGSEIAIDLVDAAPAREAVAAPVVVPTAPAPRPTAAVKPTSKREEPSDDFFSTLLTKIQTANYSEAYDPNKLVTPKDLLEEAIDNDFSLDLFSKERWPLAQNIIDWCYNPEMLGGTTRPFAKQFQVLAHFCADVCYSCSDLDYIFDVPIDATYNDLMDHFTLLNRGVCPLCHRNRTEMLNEWIVDPKFATYNSYDPNTNVRPVPYNELCCVWGQRSGKSHINATFVATYQLHRYLSLPNPMAYFGVAANKLLEIVFVAPTVAQVNKFAWDPFMQAVAESPWFRAYIDYCKVEGKRLGTKLFRAGMTFMLFPTKRIVCHMAAANSSGLRGGMRLMCLPEGTLVNTPKGLLPIEDGSALLDSGVYISGTKYRVSAHTLVGTKPVLRLTLRRGYAINATPEHRIRTITPDLNVVWKEAGDLKVGDYVAVGTGAEFPDKLNLAYVPKRAPKRELHLFEFIAELKEFYAKDLKDHPTALRGVYGITHDLIKRGMLRKFYVKGHGKNAGCRYEVTEKFDIDQLRAEVENHAFKDRDNATFPTTMTDDLGYLLGYYVSEGSYAEGAVEFNFSNTDKRVVDHFIGCFTRTFGVVPRVSLDRSLCVHGTKYKRYKPCYKVVVAYSVIKEFFRYLGMNPSVARTKSVPWSILQAPKSVVLAFLSAYIEGDGCIGKRNVSMGSTSKKLLKQIQLLLLNLGLISTLSRSRKRQRVRPVGKVFAKHDIYQLRLPTVDSIKLVKRLSCATKGKKFDPRLERVSRADYRAPFLHPYAGSTAHGGSGLKWVYTTSKLNAIYDNYALRRLEKEDRTLYSRALKLIDTDTLWFPIIAVKTMGVKPVYDISVESKTKAFIADGIVVHNSSADELGWFNTTEDGKKRTNSKDGEEVYRALQNSMKDLRSAATARRKGGDYDAVDALMVNLSSPSSKHDPIMKVAAKAPFNPRLYYTHFSSFEVNPTLDEDEIREELVNEPERLQRDWYAIPPEAVSPFFSDKQVLLDRVFKPVEGSVRPFDGYEITRVEDSNGTAVLRPVLHGLRNDKQALRVVTVDNGERKNSFALCLSRYLPEIEGLLVEELIEVAPASGRTVDLAWCHNQVVIPIVTQLNVLYVGYDRWNSGYSFYDLRLGHGVNAERYSLKWQDFRDFKEDLLGENLWFNAPEVSIEDVLKLSDLSMRARYPRAHLLAQLLTVNEFGRKVVKPDYGNDDLFRTVVLAHHFLAKNKRVFRENAKKLHKRKPAGSLVGVYRANAANPMMFNLPKTWTRGGFNYKAAMGVSTAKR